MLRSARIPAAWRLIIGGVVLAVVASGCRESGSRTTAASTESPAGTVVATPETTMANLAAAGIATVPTIASTAAQVPVTGVTVLSVTSWQADNMAREVAAGGGVVGADLDAAVPMSGAPPLSDILGAWSSAAADPAERAASQLLGKPDWGQSRDVVFPTEVLALFVGDALQHVTTQPSQSSAAGADYVLGSSSAGGGSSAVSARDAALAPASVVTAPCSAISDFFNTILSTVFNALKLDPESVSEWVSGKLGGGVIGAVVGGLAGWAASWWNHAVDTAESGLKSILGALTQPVLNVLRIAIGSVATFTIVVSYLKAWTAAVTPNPAANRFAVGNEAARTGSFTVAIDTKAEIADWPSQLLDCAHVLGITLPTLSKAGLPVTWTVFEQQPGLVTVDAPSGPPFVGTLAADLTSQLAYTAGREDATTAKGTLVTPTVTATVTVRRTEVDQLRALVTGFVTGQIPGILQPIVDPILAGYLELATQQLDRLVGVDGAVTIVVSHHVKLPPKPTPSPSAATPPSSASDQPINICTLMPQATVSGIVGHPVGAPTSTIGGFSPLASGCTYGIDDASIHYTPDDLSWCRQLESAFAGGEGYRTVPGVGDHASYSLTNGLLAFYGNTCIQTFNEYQIDRDFSLSADIALQQALRARLGVPRPASSRS
jgi:hypothetical protein